MKFTYSETTFSKNILIISQERNIINAKSCYLSKFPLQGTVEPRYKERRQNEFPMDFQILTSRSKRVVHKALPYS